VLAITLGELRGLIRDGKLTSKEAVYMGRKRRMVSRASVSAYLRSVSKALAATSETEKLVGFDEHPLTQACDRVARLIKEIRYLEMDGKLFEATQMKAQLDQASAVVRDLINLGDK